MRIIMGSPMATKTNMASSFTAAILQKLRDL
jgi:hypothetical protein